MAGTATGSAAARRTQAERRAHSRDALLAAAARGLAHHGYAELSLTRVAAEAGYTRGALHHQFAGKEDAAPAVVGWVRQTWWEKVGRVLDSPAGPGGPGDPGAPPRSPSPSAPYEVSLGLPPATPSSAAPRSGA
ncbi:TetR family transcriptional regulator [Streptomyces cyaneofuscatus]|uniref:TetR family transcriptional regulator n=1 Tax=Streptomyces cyaneofuscatus TaxID=66883 RepID=UPI00364E393E